MEYDIWYARTNTAQLHPFTSQLSKRCVFGRCT